MRYLFMGEDYMKEILEIYKNAKKRIETKFYSLLREELETKLEKNGKIDIEMLKEYQMECESYKFLDINISVSSLMVSFVALGISIAEYKNSCIFWVTAVAAVIIGGIAIMMHSKEVKHRKVLFVLNEIEKEINNKTNP